LRRALLRRGLFFVRGGEEVSRCRGDEDPKDWGLGTVSGRTQEELVLVCCAELI
jgi:hypothetical protein